MGKWGKTISVLAVLLTLPLLSAAAPEAEPTKLSTPAFGVEITDQSGVAGDTFGSGNPPYVNMTFALALSASSNYHTTITLIQTGDGKVKEKTLYTGSLAEGVYNFRAPADLLPDARGTITVKVVLKTRVFRKKFTGEDDMVFRRWEGSYTAGR